MEILTRWANQVYFCSNATLNCSEPHEAGSHREKVGKEFTDEVIRVMIRTQLKLWFLCFGETSPKEIRAD